MTDLARPDGGIVPDFHTDPTASLFDRVNSLIEDGQRFAAVQANAAQTLTYWRVGREVHLDILNEQRADYGREIVSTLSTQLVAARGRGYAVRNLRRMIQFARLFPDVEIVSTLSTQLSWSHILELLPITDDQARLFYAREAATNHLGVRELRGVIDRKAYERREIADSRIAPGSALPLDTFKDPYLLDFLGLDGTFQERDLEAAIMREMERFLLEFGTGFTFVARQKRIILDGEDFYLDLLLYNRTLRRLVAVELKTERFKAAYEGQLKLYLRWLDRYERQPGEEAPIGLLLVTKANREQIELLEMHKDGIMVTEYWTEVLPKEDLQDRLDIILRSARERLARRGIADSLTDVKGDL
ncbi:MAG: PDDEXK nuclease domain-containing protein [Propionibacteriaceae bacterium]|jgi:predicted nuclease of restriction endonuclease-like (RecB) superfamily|nr:PDDEXK nuclease domain-containing protein [Propionibacteriaceae bacterium]